MLFLPQTDQSVIFADIVDPALPLLHPAERRRHRQPPGQPHRQPQEEPHVDPFPTLEHTL